MREQTNIDVATPWLLRADKCNLILIRGLPYARRPRLFSVFNTPPVLEQLDVSCELGVRFVLVEEHRAVA